MRRLLPLILLASACGGAETSELTFPAGELTEFILRLNHGAVIVRNPRGDEKPDLCVVRVTESGGAEVLGAKERFNVSVTKARLRMRQRRNEADLRLELLVILPKGVNVDVVLNDGGVRLEGSFGLASVTCKQGDVIADPLRIAGGSLKTLNGKVRLVLTESKLESDLTCETIEGEIFLQIPLAFRGPVHLYSANSKLDYGDKPKMQLTIDPDRKNARGFAGKQMTTEELEAAHKSGRWPPGIWGKSGKGKVAFRQVAATDKTTR